MEIEQRLKAYVIEEFMGDKPELTLDSDLALIDEGVIDSLGIFVLISFIETELGVKVEPDDVVLENFETLGKLTALVESRK